MRFRLTKKAKTHNNSGVVNESSTASEARSLQKNTTATKPTSEEYLVLKTKERACALRADGKSFAAISTTLGISMQWAYKCASGISPKAPEETHRSVVRYGAHNGGCSTMSGMMPVSVQRIPTLDGVAA